MSESPINPRDFGRLEAEVKALATEVAELRGDMKALLELANKGKGGFWMGMTIASIIGGAITFVTDHLLR